MAFGKKARRKPRLTTHKLRSEWFQERTTYPNRDVNPSLLFDFRWPSNPKQYKWSDAPPDEWKWEELGPFNIGGRLTSLLVDPVNPEHLIAGAAAGGVWTSDNSGKTWDLVWNSHYTWNIGALAWGMTPEGLPFYLCGTGEANLSADNYPGAGVLLSLDPKEGWQHIAPASMQHLPLRIGALAVNPRNPDHVLLGGVTHLPTEPAGLYCSRDRGQTWERQRNGSIPFVSSRNFFCHSIQFHPEKSVVFATVEARGVFSGIWRSNDDGLTWQQLTKGLPSGDQFGRASLAIAGKTETIYAFVEKNGTGGGAFGILRSDNLGETWNWAGRRHFRNERQVSYNNCIAVHPADPDFVIVGGVDLHRTRDGGGSWEQITDWSARRGSKDLVHSDHHAVHITSKGWVYSANDGGLDVSFNEGRSWENRSRGLRCTMFYDVDVSSTEKDSYGGGAQDNGTLLHWGKDPPGEFHSEIGGDGGWLLYHPRSPRRIMGSAQRMDLNRYRTHGQWLSVTPENCPLRERSQIWMAFLALDSDRPARVFAGTTRIWLTEDFGTHWRPVSEVLDGTPITALEVHNADSTLVFAGTQRGGIFRSADGGQTWSLNVAGPELPNRIITRFAGHPADRKLIMVTTAGASTLPAVGGPSGQKSYEPVLADPLTESPRVFVSADAGLSWRPAYENAWLPDVPHHAIVFDEKRPDRIFVGGDAGVYLSQDAGHKWMKISMGLPAVMVTDLVCHDGYLFAATYGRGLWRIALPS